jgi:hypothetical protein
MKTLKTLFATALTAIFLSATAFASVAAVRGTMIEIRSANPDIKKVVVRGNLKVFIVQSPSEWISMDENDQSLVSIKQIGNTLTISSSDEKPVTLTVYVKELYRIDAADNSVVKTLGKFNVNYLQVMLKDNAMARIKANTRSIYTVIDDHANLELQGNTDKHIAKTNGVATLNTEKFAALITNHEEPEIETAMNKDSIGRRQVARAALK